jgi:hypothetical protein
VAVAVQVFEVQWLFDGKPDPLIPNRLVHDPARDATLPGSAITGHIDSNVSMRHTEAYSYKIVHPGIERTCLEDSLGSVRKSSQTWRKVVSSTLS